MSDDARLEKETSQCPICGQPYDHKREESGSSSSVLRKDATACKTDPIGRQRVVYVHLRGDA